MTTKFLGAASLIALVSACSQQPGPSAISPTEQAHKAFLAGNYAAAEQTYSGVLSANPNNATAMLGLAEVYEQSGRTAQAADLYRQVSAARSGSIRVWDTGRVMQDGVTEVATRRLGGLGHGTLAEFENPMTAQPMAYPENISTGTLAGEPVYALDQEGMVFYADPDATQPINETVYATPEAAMGHSQMMTPPPLPPAMTVPPYAAPAPAVQYAPAPIQYETAPIQYEPAPMQYEPAPMMAPAQPISYEPAPVYAPTPSYAPAPVYVPQPTYTPAPAASAPVYAPAPQRSAAMPAPVSTGYERQPGYAVVDGNFVYISAEDIAAGATAPTPTAAGPAAQGYGVPVPVSTTTIPTGTPDAYSAPRGVDVMNGIPMINLN